MARVRKLSRDEIEGVYLVREGLESITARLCARRIAPEMLRKLWRLVEEFERGVDHEEWAKVKQSGIDIHQFVAECSACQLLGDELNRLLLIERTAVAESEPLDMKKYKLSHRAIVNAIADRDESSAEYLIKKHIQNGYLEFIGELVGTGA